MFDILLNLQIIAFPSALLLMLVAGVRLHLTIRHLSTATFSVGMLLLLASQAITFVAYRVWPVAYEPAVGVVHSTERDIAVFFVATGLNVLGLLVASVSLAIFAWYFGQHWAQQGAQPDIPASGGNAG
jgi:hypothetical protein